MSRARRQIAWANRAEWRIRRAIRWFIPAALLFFGLPAVADFANGWWKSSGDCQVTQVIDGDTVGVLCDSHDAYRLRLAGIDTPELAGECMAERWQAIRATFYLRWQLLRAGEIVVTTEGDLDRYGRLLGGIALDRQSVEERLLTAGLAVPYPDGDRDWCGDMA